MGVRTQHQVMRGVFLIIGFFGLLCESLDVSQVVISAITPRYGSFNGASRLTIFGRGFSEDQFNFGAGRDKLGNSVKLVSSTRSYDCDPHKDGNTKTQITCNTRAMVADDYWVRISVDGQAVPTENHCSSPTSVKCRFTPHRSWTPTISSLGQLSDVPDQVQTINGRLMSSRFGSNVESTNGRAQKILRVYAGGQLCNPRKDNGIDLPDVNDELWGIELTKDGKSDWGYMKCKMAGGYVGNANFSFIIETYGRSNPDPSVFRVTAEDRITMFQTYAEISSITPSTGSEEGGTKLTINGRYFDQTDAPAKVNIAGTTCKVTSLSDSVIHCETEPKPTSFLAAADKHEGNRGADFGIYTDSGLLDNLDSVVTHSATPSNASHIDELYWDEVQHGSSSNYVVRMKAYFIPPRSGDYRFSIDASDDTSVLFFSQSGKMADLTQVASRTSIRKTQPSQYSQKFTLVGKNAYPIVHVTREKTGNAQGGVAVHMSETTLPGGSTLATSVRSEIQDIYTGANVKNEIQKVKLDGWSSQSKVSEVQRMTLTSANPGYVSFRFGMAGAWTGPIAGDTPGSTVAKEINALPSMQQIGASVSVSSGSASGGLKFDITFQTDLGDMDMMEAMLDAKTTRANGSFSWVEVTKGKADMSKFALKMLKAVSPAIGVSASADDVRTAVKSMFQVRCPEFILSPRMAVGFQLDFESAVENLESGTRVTDVEAFCGATCSQDPTYLFKYIRRKGYKVNRINLLQTGVLCFGYKGKLQQKIYIGYNYTSSSVAGLRTTGQTFTVTLAEAKTWKYTCLNLKVLVSNRISGLTTTVLDSVYIYKDEYTADPLYVDSILIGAEEPSTDEDMADLRRLQPPLWSPQVNVSGDASSGYEINLHLSGCPHNLPAFNVLGGVVSSDTGSQVDYNSPAWKSGATATVTRVQGASPPVNGSFSLTVGSTTLSNIGAFTDAYRMKTLLETVPGIGGLGVVRSGTCAGYTWTVTWETAPGDQDMVQIDGSGLTGDNVTSGVNLRRDGGVFFSPIPGDLLRTIHDQPQVNVDINKIPSHCSGSCQFTWESSATPTLSAISPNSGSNAASTSVTLTGTGFSTTASENSVIIGGEPCSVTTATATQIVCSVGRGPAGPQNVVVNVGQKGLARNTNGVLQFTYQFAISSLEPASGSTAGGMVLTINGTGFSANVTATVGGSDCSILTAVYSSITCRTPSGSVGTATVAVTDGVNTANANTQFTYSTSATPTVTSVSQTSFEVRTGQTITISGTGFGSSAGPEAVKINGQSASIVSYGDTEIRASMPLLPPGSYPLRVHVPGKGFADTTTNSISDMTYDLTVTNVYPLSGSMEGGTTVTLTGTGFPTDTSLIQVTVGGKACSITASTSTQIQCIAPSAATEHKIDNTGINPRFGESYAWNKPTLTIKVGDSVKWTWAAPARTSSTYKVEEIDSPLGVDAKTDGFNSGSKRDTGAFKYQFTTAGTYYYWSGYVDPAEVIQMRGVITVEERSPSTAKVELKVSGQSATYNTASGVANPTSSASCSPTTSAIAGCSESAPSTSGFTYSYLKCKTPTVSSVSPVQATAADTVTVTGTGFGTSCQSIVKIGDKTCAVQSASSTQITCRVEAGGDAQIGIAQPFSLNVANIGRALNTEHSDIKRYFVLLPHVATISPMSGSLKGGTEVTVTGSGFYGTVTVQIGSVSCAVKSMSYSQIVCVTAPASSATSALIVKVRSNGQDISAECKTGNGNCDFTFSSGQTPTVTSVSPTSVTSTGESLTIAGTGFGSVANDVNVTIGGEVCSITSITDTQIVCTLNSPVAGAHPVKVMLAGKGLADASGVTVTVNGAVSSVSPSSGGIKGGNMITLAGVGFRLGAGTTVQVGAQACTELDVRSGQEIKCRAPSGSAGAVKIQVLVDSVSLPQADYTYTTSDTPTLTGISPTSGKSGDTLTLTGTGFSSTTSDLSVSIDGVACTVTAATATSITCTLGVHSGGKYPVIVTHTEKGIASTDLEFTYSLTVTSATPNQGSYGGGQTIVLAGVGFDAAGTTITVCGQSCTVTGSVTPTQISCVTPKQTVGGATQACDVKVAVSNQEATLSSGFTYSQALTPTITNVTPRRGGTGGGTKVTIAGTGFGSSSSAVSVSIAGSTCAVETVTATEVVCTTSSRRPCIKTKIALSVGSNGIATQDSADFEYIDVWSSQFTWNYSMPETGDFVVIPADMTVLLDTDTPVMKMLLINGGKLIFDEKDVELQAENILITNGGLLQVGTEANPFQNRAIITLHGNPRSQELPIYGTKTIAVREGTVDLHGKAPSHTWTLLEGTVAAGATDITLKHAVDWKVGDFIAIGSTGDHLSQGENEMRQISAVSNGGKTLTLNAGLDYKHLGEQIDLGSGHSLDAYAPVGLLTRNVLVRGSNNSQWADNIEACPDGFDVGEFVVQTCFQGRFGAETGSDQYGAQIMFHPPRPNEKLITGRIENIEMTYVGQAFRLGRYAIHWHLNGDMSGNYVKGCAIHHSFNRAVNIHGTHYVLVQNNVVYDIMGGAIFLEDGIEVGNIFDSNLAIFVKGSSSLQNDDITPAAYWLTNPNNTVTNNVAVGGTHFAVWYRMHEHPDGPSFDPNYCPQHIPLGTFRNNTAIAMGWFGIWIFQKYYPMEGGGCKSTTPIAAKFHSLIAWNCEKGAEWVGGGAMQFIDFKMVNNKLAGIEAKMMAHSVPYSEDRGGLLKDCIIAARPLTSGKMVSQTTKVGIVNPYARGLLIKGITFLNFDQSKSAALGVCDIDGTTQEFAGGFTYKTSGLTFHNSPNKIEFRWLHEAVYHDLDGSLTGIVNGKAIATTGNLPNDKCTHNVAGMSDGAVPGSICQADVAFARFSFNKAAPNSLLSKNATFTNAAGQTECLFMAKRVTHKDGWVVILPVNQEYKMEFKDAGHITNITYTGTMYDLKEDQWVIISHKVAVRPDHFSIVKDGITASQSMVTYASNQNGDWYFDETESRVRYILSGKTSGKRRKKRGAVSLSPPESGTIDRDIKLNVYKCAYEGCNIPLGDSAPPPEGRPDTAVFWSNVSTWKNAEDGWGGNYGGGAYGTPRDGDDVKIPAGQWVVADMALPVMGKLYVYGTLELEYRAINYGKVMDFVLNCTYIVIRGGRLIVGWEDNRYTGNAQIVLRGEHQTQELMLSSGPLLGSKVIGVFGGLELHGIERSVTWTRLAQTAAAGTNTITLAEPVDWVIGDEIVIAPTAFSAWETELMKITAKASDNRTLTLNGTLAHKHLVTVTDLGGGKSATFAAEVGLLTHNIKIIGAPYDKFFQQAFGARVIVGTMSEDGNDYTGYARLSNVEFYHTGQEGYTDEYDPRFSMVYKDVGDADDTKPSSIRKCSFHHGFSPAIGTFGSNKLNITDNVVYHTVGSSIQDTGTDNAFRRNLVTLMLFPGTFNGRDEGLQQWDAGFDLRRATRPIITGNAVAGSERSAYWVDGEPCDGSTEPWSDNTAHTVTTGVQLLPEDGLDACSQLGNFTVYKAWDHAVYIQTRSKSARVVGLTAADSTRGIFPMIIGPPASKHAFEENWVEIKESTFIGRTADFDCTNDKMTAADFDNIRWSENSRKVTRAPGEGVGFIAITDTTFNQADNGAPGKPWLNLMGYMSLGGLTTVSGCRFVNFQTKCNGRRDVAVASAPNNDDVQHPLRIQAAALHNVDTDSKIHFFRPRLSTINPSDCVDMDCDGMKKFLVDDMDGSFLGTKGASAIPESEWEWDGDARRGLGDHRIPKTILTDVDGNRIQVADLAPHKGVIRDNTCTYRKPWQAWECTGLDYELFLLESLDSDTETRRLSPIAFLGDGYLDLINGPQDHGWCMGYTCQKRLSTFPILVASGKSYILHYTGPSPQHTRLRWLNAVDSQSFVIGIYYGIPQRLDVYVDDMYVEPNNAGTDSNGNQIFLKPTTSGQYMPSPSDKVGTNYFEKAINTMHVVVRGSTVVEIRTSPQIIVSFDLPPMSVEDFYGANLIGNLAAFLGIPASKIKVAKAVSETRSRRRKRSTVFSVQLEISNPPSNTTNTTVNTDDLSYDQLQNMTSQVINGIQLGTLGSQLNVTILDFGITEPVPSPDSSAWRTVVATTESGQSYSIQVQIPQTLIIDTEPVGLTEGNPLSTHPVLKFLDKNGAMVEQLGAKTAPWQVTASLVKVTTNYQQAALSGNTTADFIVGFANYTELIVDYEGTYKFNYAITYPSEATFTVQSAEFTVAARTLTLGMVSQDNETTVNTDFSVVAEVVDAITAAKVQNIAWKGHTWTCTASLYMAIGGELQGTTSVTMDPSTGQATFSNLQIPTKGRYFLQLRAISSPAAYDITVETAYIDVRPVGWTQPTIEVTKSVKLRFNVDYNSTLTNGRDAYLAAAIQNKVYTGFSSDNYFVGEVTFTEGSILATFDVSGSTAAVESAVSNLHQTVSSGGFSVNFFGQTLTADTTMWVDNVQQAVPLTSSGLSTGALVAIIVCCILLFVGVVVVLVIFKKKLDQKKKTSGAENGHHMPLVSNPGQMGQSTPRGTSSSNNFSTRPVTPAWNSANGNSRQHSSETLTTYAGSSMHAREEIITLDIDNATSPIPIDERSDSEPEDGGATGREAAYPETARSVTSARSGTSSRPPSQPSMVWGSGKRR